MRDVQASTGPIAAITPDGLESRGAGSGASAPPDAPALTADQLRALEAARRARRPIRRAVALAHVSGWTLAACAALTLLGGLFDLATLMAGLGLAAVATIELRGARDLQRLDARAPRRLALNQVALSCVLVAYSGWNIAQALLGPGAYDAHIAAGGPLADSLMPIDRLTRTVTVAFYVALALGSIVAQTCSGLYYATRRRHIEAFNASTPTWIVQTLRAAA